MAFLNWILLVSFLNGIAVADQDSDGGADDIPVIGRPVDIPFSGASGDFEVKLTVEPTTVAVEQTVTLTLVVTSKGLPAHPPRRIDLRKLPAFADRFHIEDPRDGDERRPDAKSWEFIYRVKPRRADVAEVPSLPFVYFNSAAVVVKKPFQVRHTDPIALVVKSPEPYPVALDAPERFFELAEGPELLATKRRWELPGKAFLALFLALPPLIGVGWYVLWQRLNPDAAKRSRIRRSRAAREAIHRLRRAGRLPAKQLAELASSVLAGYLHQRFDLSVKDPTPAEANKHLHQAGCDKSAAELAHFLQTCDSVRFQRQPPADAVNLTRTAERLILAVEMESCPPSS